MNIVLTNATDIFAGGEDYVLILARYLARRGHTVHISANPGHLLLRKSEEEGIPTLPILYTGMDRVFAVGRELRGHLRRMQADIVHSNANYDRTAAAIAAAFLPARHVAGVHSSHSIQHNITHWIRNRYGIDHFIADADSVQRVLVDEDGIAPERISVIPIGVEPGPSAGRKALRARARAALGVSDDTVVIGNLARLVPFKGHRVLLDAAALVVRVRNNILVPIAGDGELLEELKEQARKLGIERQVRFLGFCDNLDELYAGFDVYCHSSLELAAEAFPLAILRALAAGLPVVCTNVGGIALMVEDGVNGFLRPPDDSASLAGALLKVLADPLARASMGKASFALFERKYHAARMAETMEKVYESVCPRS